MIQDVSISPSSTYVIIWEKPGQTAGGEATKNLKIFRVKDGELLASFVQKHPANWAPQWSDDEEVMARNVTNEIQFYNGHDLGSGIQSKLFLQNLSTFSLSPGKSPCRIVAFVPENKGAPAMVRLYNMSSPNTALAHKTFYKADKIRFIWSRTGNDVLVLTSTDVDATGKSYYGETNLYLLSSTGFDCRLGFEKEGPLFDVAWNPNGKEFAATYGCKFRDIGKVYRTNLSNRYPSLQCLPSS
jgi:translation initiation factor 2A